jgi:hydrogenase-4 component A
MNRFIFADASLCAGCDSCLDACADAHKAQGLQPVARLSVVRNGDAFSPIVCRQCENAPCLTVCPTNAITMGKHSVLLSEADCIGCKLCAVACPFGVISFSSQGTTAGAANAKSKADEEVREKKSSVLDPKPTPVNEVLTVAVKCDLCEFSEKGPECVRACTTKALFLVDEKTLKRSSTAKRKLAAVNTPLLFNFFEPKT